jgi:hypothetical protein
MKTLRFFETSGTVYPMTQRNMPEDSNFQQDRGVNLDVCIPVKPSWINSVTFRRPVVTEEDTVGCGTTGNTVLTELSVATSRLHHP